MPQPWIEDTDLENPSDPYAGYAIESATYMLWALSGRKFNGVGTITETYVCPEFDLPAGCSWEDDSRFRIPSNGTYGYVARSFLGPTGQRIRLRQTPVRQIVSVKIGGEVIPSANYHVRNKSEIVLSTEVCPSLCSGPEITYKYGTYPPAIGKLAAIELANEMVRGLNHEDCALPSRVTDIQRQGLSITMFDPNDFLDKGLIGLTFSDYFLMTVNPKRAHRPAKIFSPDVPRGYTRS